MTKQQNQTNFAAYVRNVTPQAMKLTIPFGTAENMPRMSDQSFEILLNASRKRLSPVPEKKKNQTPEQKPTKEEVSTIPRTNEEDIWETY